MITAEQAREINSPAVDAAVVIAQLDALIRAAAESKRRYLRVMPPLIPPQHYAAWCMGRPSEAMRAIATTLRDHGFTVDTDAGGHHGSGFVEIRW